jgi:1-acyl-sn-glycerol-3-phosphate acyltransferase
VILCPNHASQMDMDLAFELSILLQEQLYFLCAREVFRGGFFNRHVLQLCGCYSVTRGKTDSNSFKKSVEILEDGLHKLVIFPEGEISNCDNLVLPLKPGPAHIAITASERLHGKKIDDDVSLVAVALRYTYPDVPLGQTLRTLIDLEVCLGIKPISDDTIGVRVSRLVDVILKSILDRYGHKEFADTMKQCESTCTEILKQLALYVNYEPPQGLDEIELAHRIYLRLYEARWFEEQLETNLNFIRHHERHLLLNQYIHDYHRLMNFMAIRKSGAYRSNLNDLITTLMTVKREVIPDQNWRLPITVKISFGKPITTTARARNQQNKTDTIHELTSRLNHELETELSSLITNDSLSN